ncbi:unnamed protein product [Amoebophrya sp. A120]|nr:unnamed protein product [Amoebophrya sp. A120]|eukprot:GSA120T00005605001.1
MNASGGTNWPSDPNAYEKTTLIGTGASAKVHIAKTNDNRICALKILDLEALVHDDVLDEIRKELQAMALCRHPNVISHYVSFPYKRQMWLVMPLMPGGSAADLLRSQFPHGFKNELGILLHILYETLKALEYLHDDKNKQIHRDLKAANLLLGAQGEVCLADFGVAATLKEQRTRNTFVGTPCWMAPEVLQAGQSGAQGGYTQKADIWSLGITALELYNGEAPYQRLHHLKIMQNILDKPPPVAPQEADPGFREFVSYCLQKNPSKRPGAKELIGARNFGWERRTPDRLKAIIERLPPLEERRKIKQLAERNPQTSGASGGPKGQSGATEEWNFDLPEDETSKDLAADKNVPGHVTFAGLPEDDEA